MNEEKDFDRWNALKKKTEEKPDNFGVNQREIWWTSLGLNVGVETDGKNADFEIVIKKIQEFLVVNEHPPEAGVLGGRSHNQ